MIYKKAVSKKRLNGDKMNKKYQIIYADPPWEQAFSGEYKR